MVWIRVSKLLTVGSFCVALKLKMSVTFLKGYKKKTKKRGQGDHMWPIRAKILSGPLQKEMADS